MGEINVNGYIPPFVSPDLSWYERHGLLTYIDQLKYECFSENPDSYLKRANVVNFDIIRHHCHGDKLMNSVEYYKTIKKDDFNNFDKKEKEKSLATIARCKRKDLWVQQDLMTDYLKLCFNF